MRRTSSLGTLSVVLAIACCLLVGESSRGELLLMWTFDEAASGDHNALNLGAAAGVEGVFNGGATRTDNTPGGASRGAADLLVMENGFISAADSSALDALDQITITAWINHQADPVGNHRIAALQDGTENFNGFSLNNNAPEFGDYSADNFRLGMFVGGVDDSAFGRSEDIVDLGGEWIFVATTYDGFSDFDNLVFYLGTEEMQVAEHFFPLTAAAGPIAAVEPGTGFHVGRTDAAPQASTSLDGFIDDVRIYNEILTLEQLEVIRAHGLIPETQGFPFGEYNGNGLVEQGDLDLVLLNWGQDANFPPEAWVNDLPEGIIDQGELDRVVLNWGNTTAPGGAQPVPEPSSFLLAGLLWLASHGVRRRRKPRLADVATIGNERSCVLLSRKAQGTQLFFSPYGARRFNGASRRLALEQPLSLAEGDRGGEAAFGRLAAGPGGWST